MPLCTAVRTTARTAGFMPPASPPLVSTAMLEGPIAEGAVAVSVMKEARGQDLSGHQSYCDDVRYVPYVSKGRPTAGRRARARLRPTAAHARRAYDSPADPIKLPPENSRLPRSRCALPVAWSGGLPFIAPGEEGGNPGPGQDPRPGPSRHWPGVHARVRREAERWLAVRQAHQSPGGASAASCMSLPSLSR